MGKPAATLECPTVRTESLTHEGLAVAHLEGKAVFIQGALPGETVRFRYQKRHRRYDTAVAVEILEPSADRTEPVCPHFGVCGGCSLQHLAPAAQVAAKQNILLENLARIGKVVPERVLPPVTGPTVHYRRRARLGVRLVPKKGGVLVGFRERQSAYLTNLSDCLVLDARVGPLIPRLRDLVAGLSCPDRIPQIEVAAADAHLALVFRHLMPLPDRDLALLRRFGQDHTVVMYLQPEGPDSVHRIHPDVPVALTYAPDHDLTLEFEPTDFVQINRAVNEQLIALAQELLAIGPTDRVVDFFCGLGNFSLPIARRCAAVVGVEGSAALVERARANAARNRITNATFRCADLYGTGLPAADPWWNAGFDKALLDPPRAGAMELIKTLDGHALTRILYVSCYPATLARDSEYLTQVKGYRLAAAGVLDMFPHTSHVESYALFEHDHAH